MNLCLLGTYCIEDCARSMRFWSQCRAVRGTWPCVVAEGEGLVHSAGVLLAPCALGLVVILLIVLHVVLPLGEVV